MLIISSPIFAQFTGGVTIVDPTTGAQSLAKFLIDGLLYVAAAAAAICFIWGIFRLFSRPLEGILEVALGLTVFFLIGHILGWASGLTGVVVG
jgi:cation transport ATPase